MLMNIYFRLLERPDQIPAESGKSLETKNN